MKSIRDGNTHQILTLLASLANSEDSDKQEKFAQFYAEFGDVITKEGVGEDIGNQERILPNCSVMRPVLRIVRRPAFEPIKRV